MLKDIDFTIEGERALFTEYAKIIPLLEEHFKDFDGERAIIGSGDRSAKFARINREFGEAARDVSTARAFVNTSNGMSAWLKIDITLPDPRAGCSGCIYFAHSVPVGNIESFGPNASGNFEYTFDADAAREHVSNVLATDPEHLQAVRDDIERLQQQIINAQAAIPYEFRACIIESR